MQKYLWTLLVILCTLLSACEWMPVYKIDRQQGNILTQADVNRLRPGMSKSQVQYLLGTPVLEHNFDVNRWDYVYSYKPGGKPTQVKNMALHFRNDRLMSISGTVRPGMSPGNEQAMQQVIAKQTAKAPKPVTNNPATPANPTIPQPFNKRLQDNTD